MIQIQKRGILPFYIFLCFLAVLCLLCGCSGASSDNSADIMPEETEAFLPDSAEAPQTEESTLFTESAAEPITTESVTTVPVMTVPVTTEEVTTAQVTETTAAKVEIPRFVGKSLDEVLSMLKEAGVGSTVEYEASKLSKDTVLKVRFMGTVGETSYLLSQDETMTLIVSDGSLQKPKRYRYNVKAVDEKKIYLTFDDGPGELTADFLKILADYDIHATFFMVGQYVKWNPELVRQVWEAGHRLGCHSYTHDYTALYQSPQSLMDEVEAWEKAVIDAIGEKPAYALFRFPGGSNMSLLSRDDTDELYWTLHDSGYTCFDWTCAANDKWLVGKPADMPVEDYLKQCTVETVQSLVRDCTTPFIYIMHDTSQESLNVLPWVLDYLIGEGFTFGTLDELDGDWLFY